MEATGPERYAVVSCHVERLLDDEVWARFRRLLVRRPGGFPVVSLLRPPDPAFAEDERRWLERAREAARLGPFGHHVHWTAPDHARPTGGSPAERVRQEGVWLRERGLHPSLFCGGGWYTDGEVAEACAELGYVDCTPRAERPAYLDDGARWAQLDSPRPLSLPSGRKLATLPTTHSVGPLARALATAPGPKGLVHVYFHDTDLVDRGRGLAVTSVLRLLRARRRAADAATVARAAPGPPSPWDAVARPGRADEDAA